MKTLVILAPVLIFAGCCGQVSEEQTAKIKEWGATTNIYCEVESGFMMKEYFEFRHSEVPKRAYIKGYNSNLVSCKEKFNALTK